MINLQNVFIHPSSDVQTKKIGELTKIWQFCILLPGCQIGNECNICSHVFIENDVLVGSRVTIKAGVQLWDGLRVEDDVFIGPNVSFVNDMFPRSKVRPVQFLQTFISQGCSIGANATIIGGITLGRKCIIGAGSVVLCDVPAHEVWAGNPAKFIRRLSS
jgi:UDP-2-acetamido-3-amino-2,3-dideoxy-glucuronate N-acetyltransferase